MVQTQPLPLGYVYFTEDGSPARAVVLACSCGLNNQGGKLWQIDSDEWVGFPAPPTLMILFRVSIYYPRSGMTCLSLGLTWRPVIGIAPWPRQFPCSHKKWKGVENAFFGWNSQRNLAPPISLVLPFLHCHPPFCCQRRGPLRRILKHRELFLFLSW